MYTKSSWIAHASEELAVKQIILMQEPGEVHIYKTRIKDLLSISVVPLLLFDIIYI